MLVSLPVQLQLLRIIQICHRRRHDAALRSFNYVYSKFHEDPRPVIGCLLPHRVSRRLQFVPLNIII